MEKPVENPGPTRRQEVQPGGARFPHFNRRWEDSAGCGRRDDAGSEASEWELWERRERGEDREAEAEALGGAGELGAGEEPPLFLPTPSFMASVEEV